MLFLFTIGFLLFSSVLGQMAPHAESNLQNIVAVADFPEAGHNKYTKGNVYFTSSKGDSVKVHIDMTGLPSSGGPFTYHVHNGQIFNTATCEEAGTPLDPHNGLLNCPQNGNDSLCQVGDLSGKHGWINTTCFQAEYYDPFISLNPESESYIVGKSLVFHDQTSIPFACANIYLATAEQYEYLTGETSTTDHGANGESNHISEKPSSNQGKTELEETHNSPTMAFSEETSSNETSSEHSYEPTSTAISESTITEIVEGEDRGEGVAPKTSQTSSEPSLAASEGSAGSLWKTSITTAIGLIFGILF